MSLSAKNSAYLAGEPPALLVQVGQNDRELDPAEARNALLGVE